MMKWLGSKNIGYHDQIIAETDAYFEGLEQSYSYMEYEG